MICTPAEAESLICPQSLIGLAKGAEPSGCVGPACNAWRVARLASTRSRRCENREATKEPARPDGVPASWVWHPHDAENDPESGALWLEDRASVEARTSGFCGLAGIPVELPVRFEAADVTP